MAGTALSTAGAACCRYAAAHRQFESGLWDHSVDFLRNAISYPGDEGRNGRHAFLQVCCCPHTVRQMLGQPGILSRNSFKFEAYRISKLNPCMSARQLHDGNRRLLYHSPSKSQYSKTGLNLEKFKQTEWHALNLRRYALSHGRHSLGSCYGI